MSKADCEQFDFNNTGIPTPEFAGQAVANNNHEPGQEGYNSLIHELKVIAEQAERLTAAARNKVRELQIAEATEGVQSIDLQPDLQPAWDGLCLAWYQLKLQNGHSRAASAH